MPRRPVIIAVIAAVIAAGWMILWLQGPPGATTAPPTAVAPPIAAPDTSTPQDGGDPWQATATRPQVEKFLNTYLTYTWQDNPADLKARVRAAGGKPGTPASTPWYRTSSREICISQTCSQEVTRIGQVTVDPGQATADVDLIATVNGNEQRFQATCRITVGPEPGQFTDIICPGGDG